MNPPLAERRPVLFSALVTLGFVVVLILIVIVQRPVAAPALREVVGAAGRALVGIGALWGLAALGWRRWLAGPGSALGWALVVPSSLYLVAIYPLLLTGTYSLTGGAPRLVLAVALGGLVAGVMEELVFRGLVLGSLLRAWGRADRSDQTDQIGGGVWRALVVSSVLFSAPHILNLLVGADPVRTGAQLVWALLLGVVLGALTVASGSLWPAAALHGLANAFVHANRVGHDVALAPTSAVLLALAPVPLVLGSWWVLRRVRRLAPAPSGRSSSLR